MLFLIVFMCIRKLHIKGNDQMCNNFVLHSKIMKAQQWRHCKNIYRYLNSYLKNHIYVYREETWQIF